MQVLPVKEVMTKKLVTVHMYQSVTDIAEIFNTSSFHHIPIINDDECLEGIVSLTDFERIKNGNTFFRNPNKDKYDETLFKTMLAMDMMTKDVVEIRPSDTIHHAYNIFKKNKFRALPVIDKGKVVGIVTPLDLLDYFFQKKP